MGDAAARCESRSRVAPAAAVLRHAVTVRRGTARRQKVPGLYCQLRQAQSGHVVLQTKSL
eukprot:768380-Hanusia_phi.AAC.2